MCPMGNIPIKPTSPAKPETMALKQQYTLADTTTDGEDALITIRGFLNIVALIQRVESDAEKIALNCLLLLITGFRSIEAFNLRQDALFKRQIDDPAIRGFRIRDYPIISLVSVMLVSKVLGANVAGRTAGSTSGREYILFR